MFPGGQNPAALVESQWANVYSEHKGSRANPSSASDQRLVYGQGTNGPLTHRLLVLAVKMERKTPVIQESHRELYI